MQLFSSNYLEIYPQDDIEKLQKLSPFLINILSRINRGSVAKKRIFVFIEVEAKNAKNYENTSQIMTRQSVKITLADKSSAIQIILKIYNKYPHLALPIEVTTVV